MVIVEAGVVIFLFASREVADALYFDLMGMFRSNDDEWK